MMRIKELDLERLKERNNIFRYSKMAASNKMEIKVTEEQPELEFDLGGALGQGDEKKNVDG